MNGRRAGAGNARTCPRCDGQGEVVNAVVLRTGERTSIRDECDATWMPGEQVSGDRWTDFGTIRRERGLASEWREIETMAQTARTNDKETSDGA